MNGTQFIEAARYLAQRALLKGGDTLDSRLDFITLRVIARRLEIKERSILTKAYRDYLNYYDSNPGDAKKLLAEGEAEVDPNVNPSELAAMTMAASQVMNLDEVLNK